MSTRSEWVSANRAAEITGRTAYSLLRLAVYQEIRCKATRGEGVRYHKDDVARLATENGRVCTMAMV